MLFLAVTSVFVAAAAALPSTPFAYPEGVTVTEYPNGLPEELKPSSEGSALEKRGNAGVYACNERNFGGFCVHLVVQEYTCGECQLLEDLLLDISNICDLANGNL
jgi:hypothetical protein